MNRLTPEQARRRFVEWAQNEIAVVPDFHKRIFFSDEAHFWLNGYVNKQNCCIWSEANPQASCDLTPLDYFLWGYVKSLVYADKPQTLDHLEDNIRRVIADIRPQMLEKVIENWTSRLDYIRASRGSPMPEIIFKIRNATLQTTEGVFSFVIGELNEQNPEFAKNMKYSLIQRINERRNVNLIELMQYLNFVRKYEAAAVTVDISQLPVNDVIAVVKIVITVSGLNFDNLLTSPVYRSNTRLFGDGSGDFRPRIQICIATNGRKRLHSVLDGVVHKIIGGNRPTLPQSFELSSPQSSMECFMNTELADRHLIYVLAEGNARAAEKLF
ncbi:uncharacterized protein TNCV_1643881 [Trichonephila clavipes]|nr:uncharacterized protein TNCV_1643881 [Trichonephila clavipes]